MNAQTYMGRKVDAWHVTSADGRINCLRLPDPQRFHPLEAQACGLTVRPLVYMEVEEPAVLALRKIEESIYAIGAPLGSKQYFEIRQTIRDILNTLDAASPTKEDAMGPGDGEEE